MSKCNLNNSRFLSLDSRAQFIQTLQAAFQFLNRLASQIADGSVYAASSAPFFNLHPFFSTLNWEMSQACQLTVSRNIYCLNVSLLQYCRILLNANRWYSKKNCCRDFDLISNINNENFKTVLGVKLCHAWVVRK